MPRYTTRQNTDSEPQNEEDLGPLALAGLQATRQRMDETAQSMQLRRQAAARDEELAPLQRLGEITRVAAGVSNLMGAMHAAEQEARIQQDTAGALASLKDIDPASPHFQEDLMSLKAASPFAARSPVYQSAERDLLQYAAPFQQNFQQAKNVLGAEFYDHVKYNENGSFKNVDWNAVNRKLADHAAGKTASTVSALAATLPGAGIGMHTDPLGNVTAVITPDKWADSQTSRMSKLGVTPDRASVIQQGANDFADKVRALVDHPENLNSVTDTGLNYAARQALAAVGNKTGPDRDAALDNVLATAKLVHVDSSLAGMEGEQIAAQQKLMTEVHNAATLDKRMRSESTEAYQRLRALESQRSKLNPMLNKDELTKVDSDMEKQLAIIGAIHRRVYDAEGTPVTLAPETPATPVQPAPATPVAKPTVSPVLQRYLAVPGVKPAAKAPKVQALDPAEQAAIDAALKAGEPVR